VNKISITLCECLVASTGSILISSAQEISTRLTVNCKIHIVIAFTSQIVNTISDSLQYIEKKYLNNQPRQLTYITGASKTADIEQQLVYGAHGPKEIFCFLIEN
ncbi:MAG: lactate utilization protein C, partial [Bacteroidota bacterium]